MFCIPANNISITIVTSNSSETLQLQRLKSRNSLSQADAQARIGSQAPLSSKLIYADHVIDNSGPLPDLTDQVTRVIKKLQARAGWSWWVSWLCPPIGILRGILLIGWRLYIKGVGKAKVRRKSRGEKDQDDIYEMNDRKGK